MKLAGLEALGGRRVIASISGGKDSTAMGLAFQAAGVPFTPVFLDTGWETPWTYTHIREDLVARFGPIVERRAEITLPPVLEVIAQGFEARLGHYSAMVRLCLKKGMFPSRVRRVCTQVLKVFTMRDYLAELAASGEPLVNAVGIRREESAARALAPVWSTSQTYQAEIWHPLAFATEAEVIEAHHEGGMKPNPHYLAGSERVGCLPCIHARKSEIAAMARYHPERVALLADLEDAVANLAEARAAALGTTLEARGHHRPAWFQSRKDDRRWVKCPDCSDRAVLDDDDCYALGPDDAPACATCGGEGKVRTKGSKTNEMWPIAKVVAWSQTNRKGELFTPEPHEEGCMKWGLCDLPLTPESMVLTEGKPMLYVKRVRTNAKKGADVILGPKTLIVGENGSGKSTIVNGIELALTGRVSDVAGHETIALPVELLALAPSRSGELWADVVLSNDDAHTFRMEGSPGKGSRPVLSPHVEGDGVFPIRMLADAFSSPAKARMFLVERAKIGERDAIDLLPTSLHDLYAKVAKAKKGATPGDTLVAVIEYANQKKREARADAKASSTVADANAATATPVSEAEEAIANRSLERAQNRLRDIRERAHAARLAANAKAQRAQLQARLDAMGDVSEGDVEAHGRGQARLALIDFAIERGTTSCPLCAQPFDGEQWVERKAKLVPLVAKLRPSPRYREAEKLRDDIAAIDAMPEPEGLAPGESLEIAEMALKSSQALVTENERRKTAYAHLLALKNQGYEATQDSERWDSLATECSRVAGELVTLAVGRFEASVQRHLPDGDVFRLRLAEGARSVVQFGLEVDGVLHTALSGAEWARVTCALSMALAASQPFAVVVPAERAYSPKTLRETMIALADAPFQVIITSPTAPAGRTPKGWTIVRTGKVPGDEVIEEAKEIIGQALRDATDPAKQEAATMGADSSGPEEDPTPEEDYL